jgi:very-short-patch-repair endonuclease
MRCGTFTPLRLQNRDRNDYRSQDLFMTMFLSAFALAMVAFYLAVVYHQHQRQGRRSAGRPMRRKPLTHREQAMYNLLTQCMPDHFVLAQVALSALLTSHDRATRNVFSRKVADFVVCSRAFEVLAVIELDDKSHRSRDALDAKRDAILTRAGYRVLRYPEVPDVMDLLRDFQPPSVAANARTR